MADTFQLEVATPERLLVDEQVTEAELPGQNGYMGILAGHAPLLSALGAGVLTYKTAGGERVLAIEGGFVEIFDNHVRVLAEHAGFPEDIDIDKARQDLNSANEALRHADTEAAATQALFAARSAQARIDASGR
ncbi:MAG: ATP synthase F1 subunit epsilon [Acidobacteriaceae bacterium]|nr:ATP synthase F1 subunit epsilon [Acidobacteriaceae bacterium]MBV9781884.1 ATP synthase F1 subunit epsilon [Acidobacteriaceae bacterium]